MIAVMSWRRGLSVSVLIVGLAGFLWMRGCDERLPEIEVAEGIIHVRNITDQEWRNVRIWVNEYYAVSVRSIPPAGFVRERVRRFVAAQGQTINTSTTPVTSVVVLAVDADGARVRIVWGTPVLH
jgi:hypothetical protein